MTFVTNEKRTFQLGQTSTFCRKKMSKNIILRFAFQKMFFFNSLKGIIFTDTSLVFWLPVDRRIVNIHKPPSFHSPLHKISFQQNLHRKKKFFFLWVNACYNSFTWCAIVAAIRRSSRILFWFFYQQQWLSVRSYELVKNFSLATNGLSHCARQIMTGVIAVNAIHPSGRTRISLEATPI